MTARSRLALRAQLSRSGRRGRCLLSPAQRSDALALRHWTPSHAPFKMQCLASIRPSTVRTLTVAG